MEYNGGKLIPTTVLSESEKKALQSKGGKVSSPRKRMAAQIRHMRKKGAKNAQIQRWLDLLESEEFSLVDTRKYIDTMTNIAIRNEDYRLLSTCIKLMMDWHKLRHGSKHKEVDITQVHPTEIIIEMPNADTL